MSGASLVAGPKGQGLSAQLPSAKPARTWLICWRSAALAALRGTSPPPAVPPVDGDVPALDEVDEPARADVEGDASVDEDSIEGDADADSLGPQPSMVVAATRTAIMRPRQSHQRLTLAPPPTPSPGANGEPERACASLTLPSANGFERGRTAADTSVLPVLSGFAQKAATCRMRDIRAAWSSQAFTKDHPLECGGPLGGRSVAPGLRSSHVSENGRDPPPQCQAKEQHANQASPVMPQKQHQTEGERDQAGHREREGIVVVDPIGPRPEERDDASNSGHSGARRLSLLSAVIHVREEQVEDHSGNNHTRKPEYYSNAA